MMYKNIAMLTIAMASSCAYGITRYDAEAVANDRFDSLYNYRNQSRDNKTTLDVLKEQACNYRWASSTDLAQMNSRTIRERTDNAIIDGIRSEVGTYARNVKKTSDAVAQHAAKIVADSAKKQTFDGGLFNFVGPNLIKQANSAVEQAKAVCPVHASHGGPAIEDDSEEKSWFEIQFPEIYVYFGWKTRSSN